jgi:DNA-binding CsgD family transcriptional regulator
VYVQISKPLGAEYQVAAFISKSSGGKGFISLSLDRPFGAAQIKRLQYVVPHLVRAAKIYQKVYVPSCPREGADAAFDLLPCGLVTLAWNGIVLHANREAERILRQSDGLGLCSGRLETSDPKARSQLHAAVAQAASAGTGTWSATPLAIRRPSERRPYEVLVAPIAPRSQELAFSFLATASAAFVLVSDPELAPAPPAVVLQRLYNLTPALARLAAALAAGKTIAEYAGEARVTQGTARQQLKELFARTQTRRQAELVRILLRGVGQFRL